MVRKKGTNSVTKSRVVENQPANIGEILVRDMDKKGTRRCWIETHVCEYSNLAR
jgi:hypothetical protein